MSNSEKLMELKKAYAEIILNTAKEAAARVMMAERRAFRYQRELADTKEDAVRMMVRLKHLMDSRIYKADTAASLQQSKIEELEAQLHEAEDIVKDLREELSIVRDRLDDATKKLSLQQANYIVLREQEEDKEVHPCICDDHQVLNTQVEQVAAPELGNLSNQKISESIRDDHYEALRADNLDLAPTLITAKKLELLRNGSPKKINELVNEDLNDGDGLNGESHFVKDESKVREDCQDSRTFITPNSSADLFVSERKSHMRMKQVKKSCPKISLAMKIRSHNLRFKKTNTRSSLNKRQSSEKVMKSLKKTYLVTLKTSHTAVVQSDVICSAVREPEGQKRLGLSSDTAELCSKTGFRGSLQPCSIQSTPENDKSSMDKASTGEENGSAESTVTCVDAEIACAPSCSVIEESDELAVDDALRTKNDSSIKFTFQRKRKKEAMGSADDNDIVEVVKRSLDKETVVKQKNIESTATGLFTRSSQQSDDKEDTLKEFKRSLKKMNVEKQVMKGSSERMDIDMSTDTQPKVIGIVPKASRGTRRLAQVARQLLSMSQKKCWD
ncbi:unnamed protein product [Rhodiola kirilowii]